MNEALWRERHRRGAHCVATLEDVEALVTRAEAAEAARDEAITRAERAEAARDEAIARDCRSMDVISKIATAAGLPDGEWTESGLVSAVEALYADAETYQSIVTETRAILGLKRGEGLEPAVKALQAQLAAPVYDPGPCPLCVPGTPPRSSDALCPEHRETFRAFLAESR